ncbi:MAG: hypothetical protein WBM75_02230 [Polyangiales bacterium]
MKQLKVIIARLVAVHGSFSAAAHAWFSWTTCASPVATSSTFI